MRVVVAITGASGIIYATKLINYLKGREDVEVSVVVSKEALIVAKHEPCWEFRPCNLLELLDSWKVEYYMEDNLLSPLASSSNAPDATVVVPCSMKSLSAIANSFQDNLIIRVALSALRLRKPLVLVVRETPLSTLDILNMLKASLAGATILPASPAFYINPQNLDDLVNFVVGKILDVLGIPHNLYRRWRQPR